MNLAGLKWITRQCLELQNLFKSIGTPHPTIWIGAALILTGVLFVIMKKK
ncbi:hypothetical protein PAEVO_25390 [Paenibacillus sp. GM2FR]|nr:hypothetical protein PAEVO_25390 [Paenibacillus sp. GM2FR]